MTATTTQRIFDSLEEATAAKAKGTDLIREICGRCGGPGRIPAFGFIEGGICFECRGAGSHTVQVRSVKARIRREAKRIEEAKKREAEIDAKITACEEWKRNNPEICGLIAELADTENQRGLAYDLLNDSINIPTSAQIEALHKIKAERDQREAARKPVETGTQIIEGIILTMKWQENTFAYHGSGSLKMLVADDRGFKVWGTCPSSLDADRGDRVRFTATVEASERDFDFGFFKRPRRAELVEPA